MPLILLILVGGCRGERGILVGSSMEEISGDALSQSADLSLSVSPAELMDDPAAYVGDHLQLAGTLYRAPTTRCNSKARLYPANWILSDGELEIPVASTSQELNQLATDVSGVILVGRWLHWQGLVGCGREAEVDEQWFLDVDRIVSPNPIALVPVISASPVQDLVESGPQPVLTRTGVPTGSSASSTPTVSEEPFVDTATPIPQQNIMTQTAGAVTATIVSATSSITPTPQGNQGSFLPTATSTQEIPDLLDTATPTATESPLQTIFRMALDISSIETGRLGQNEIHRWTHEITSTKQLTVSLASDHRLDLSVSIVDAGGHIVAQQNAAINGEPEILSGVTLMDPGIYDILVSSPSGEPGDYAILISDNESYPYYFQGTLHIDEIGNAVMARDSDHFWHFAGKAGQAISISVVPTDDSDLFLNLFGTDGVSLIRFHDETASGEPEQIIGYVLLDNGIYSLRIGEFNFGSAEYEIYLTDD